MKKNKPLGTRYKNNEKIDDKKIIQRHGMRFILNKTIESSEERMRIVENIIQELGEDSFKNSELQALSNYVIDATVKENNEKRGPILTDNRMVTIRTRETSSDALIDDKLEGGEDTFHQLLAKNPRNSILTNKTGITQEDLDTIPGLKQLVDTIEDLVLKLDEGIKEGKDVRYLRKNIIELRKMQYDIKNAYKQPMHLRNNVSSFGEQKRIDIDFTDLKSVFNFMKDYEQIEKEITNNDIGSDTYLLLDEFRILAKKALENQDENIKMIFELKLIGYNNTETSRIVSSLTGKKIKIDKIGKIYRETIPSLICNEAKKKEGGK